MRRKRDKQVKNLLGRNVKEGSSIEEDYLL